MDTQHYTLDELCTLTRMTKRTIRYYLQQQLVDKPLGTTRGSYYTQAHLEQLLLIQHWQRAGLNLERIREILHGDASTAVPPRTVQVGEVRVCTHVHLAAGVQLVIDPQEADMPAEKLRTMIARLQAVLQEVTKEGAHD